MSTGDRDMVGRLLKQSILTMCKEAVHYDSMLEIDGLICVTTDNGQRQVVIKIHEIFHKLPRHGAMSFAGDEKSFVVKQNSKNPNITCIESVMNETDQNDMLIQKNALDDSDSTLEDETSASTSRDMSRDIRPTGFPDNIDEEMHTLAIYKVYKDSKTIGTKRDDSGSEMTVDFHERENKSSPDPTRLQDTGGNQASLSEDFDRNSDQRNKSSSNGVERYPNLQASTLINISCKKCNAVLENGTAYEAHNTSVHSIYTCFVCLNTFTSKNNMTRHIRIHSGTKPYSCPRCPERFTRKDDVKRHILRHDFNKPFRCALCNMGYTEKTTMKVHFERDHGSTVFFTCSQCGKCYNRDNEFQIHKKLHPEFRQFSCNICIFTGSSSLMYHKHMLLHENGKTYTCTHCNDMKFKDPFIYTSHLKKHRSDQLVKSFKCCFCDVSLASYDQFARHEHTHVQERRYSCKVCLKGFEWLGHLQDHMMTHGQEQEKTKSMVATETDVSERQDDSYSPKRDENLNEVKESVDYWCTECSLGFASENSLERHILETHEMASTISLDQRLNAVDKSYKLISNKTDDAAHGTENTERVRLVPYGKPYQDDEKLIDAHKRLQSSETKPILPINNDVQEMQIFEKQDVYSDEAEDLSMNKRESDRVEKKPIHQDSDNLQTDNQLDKPGDEITKQTINEGENRPFAMDDSPRKYDIRSLHKLYQRLQHLKRKEVIPTSVAEGLRPGNIPMMSILGNNSYSNNEANASPKAKIPKLFSLIFGQSPTEGGNVIKTEPVESLSDASNVMQTNQYSDDASQSDRHDVYIHQRESYPVIKKIKIEKLDDFGPPEAPIQTDLDSITVSSIPKPNFLQLNSVPYSTQSTVAENIEQSSVRHEPLSPAIHVLQPPLHHTTTSVKLKTRGPGFEKVVTPEVLFRAKAPFTCEDCNGVFEDFPSFDQHGIQVHHSFVCEYCGKVFTAKPNRERHVRYHTGEKPYRCELCDESYFRGDDLKYHRTAKHGDIRPYVCKGCARSFIWKKDLEKHVRRYPDHK